MQPTIEQQIADAVMETPDVSPVAKEKAAPLVSAYVEKYLEKDTQTLLPVAVEREMVLELNVPDTDKRVVFAGKTDLIFRLNGGDAWGVGEWKTSSGWEKKNDWETKARYSTQARRYLLMATELGIIPPDVEIGYVSRAVTKDGKLQHYSTEWVSVDRRELREIKLALWYEIEQELRLRKWVPDGPWLRNQPAACYRWGMKYVCEYRGMCDGREQPPTFVTVEPHLEAQRETDALVYTHSSLELFRECPERYRLNGVVKIGEPPNLAQQVGTVFHHGVATMYRIIKEG